MGFESRSEVRITTGAIVDAVWEAKIGNMGKAIYVFEVQSKGSIDSLILNLKKAQSNAAVQAVVAVADEEQLAKIIRESAGVIVHGIPTMSSPSTTPSPGPMSLSISWRWCRRASELLC